MLPNYRDERPPPPIKRKIFVQCHMGKKKILERKKGQNKKEKER
jgi:hypothetical protein